MGAKRAEAYPHFVGYSYSSCAVCHYNPLGNGPLTDYGRALGAIVVAAKPPFFKGNEEALGKSAALFGKNTDQILPTAVRAQLNYRGLFIKTGEGEGASLRHIPMVLDGSIILQSPNSRYFAVMNLGQYPTQKGQAELVGSWISREHYLGFRPNKKMGIYLGFMDIAYGIRLPDHHLSSRRMALVNQSDQTHGVLLHTAFGKLESSFHFFAGNLLNSSPVRNRGVSFVLERSVPGNVQLGLSGMRTSNEFRERTAFAPHTRIGMGKGSALLSELGFIFETVKSSNSLRKQQYWVTQGMTRLAPGFNLITTVDYSTREAFRPGVRRVSFGPGFQYYPFSRLELRSDLLISKQIGAISVTEDELSWMSQVHIWL